MSKIEVDAITEQSGSTLTTGGGAGKTVVVDATTVTLGRCGGTVALASVVLLKQVLVEQELWIGKQLQRQQLLQQQMEKDILQIQQVEHLTVNLPAGSLLEQYSFSCRLYRIHFKQII